ncbi:MAG TPA: prenyltransferase/squalene oxidase repeat-containing protein [Vicinamibacterales bacterium]|nr:prenyltransferase/squalene oxidase repeat-containing protein [Vicinamibacterales bacterium]
MLQVARLAPTLLGESRELVRAFLQRSLNPDGGFQNRNRDSDLYYTVFGLEALLAVHAPVPDATRRYLETFGDGADLDFVHLTCLARAWGSVDRTGAPAEVAPRLQTRLEAYRSNDGGYGVSGHAETGSAYACFLAMGAYQDLGSDGYDAAGMLRCLNGVRAADGGYANHAGAAEGSTPATAAAVMVMRHLDVRPDEAVSRWLLARCHRDGGFFAAPRAPLPDLLSTATALHALSALQADTASVREPCLDFVDTLWTSTGGFYGSWADQILDCEYTYYGLLALGHLSL